MKAFSICTLGLLLGASTLPVFARDTAPRYKFTAGTTNVFAVDISVRSESGSEVMSGNVIVVTKDVSTNSARLACRSLMKMESKRTPPRGPGLYGGYFPGMTMPNQNVFPNDCEIELNDRGVELRDGGDYVLAVPLGKLVQSIFEPLPAKAGNEETSDLVSVLDDPYWLGPAENFLNLRMNGQPYGMRFNLGYPQQSLATLTLARRTVLKVKNSKDDAIEWHLQTRLESFTRTGADPRLTATSETDFSFDRNAGLPASIETQAEVSSQTDTASRKAKLSFKVRRLTRDELAAALAPPPPPAPPRNLTAEELDKISADLKSPELETRRAALRQLNGREVTAPTDEFTALIGSLALDSDMFTRMTASTYLGVHATTNEVPVLLKLLKDSDWSSRQNATKALGRLKDARAIQPLADLIARNGNSFGQDTSSALINIGAPAEKAVLGLLNERNAETQRQACTILQQIGTDASLEPLQKLVGDGEQSVSQAAVEAIRAIKMRQ